MMMTREQLKGRALDVLNYIRTYQRDNDGATPSHETIAKGVGIHSSQPGGILNALEAKGYIEREAQVNRNIPRAITIVEVV